jgi:Protein of unknown function (DUF3592)
MFAAAPFRWTDPTTWPGPFDVWLALLVGGWLVPGLWQWLQRRQAAGWPLTNGRFESTESVEPNFARRTRRGHHVARLRYSYSVFGNAYSGVYKRTFPTKFGARNFLRDLEGKAVVVRYSPSRPSRSFVLDRDIQMVLLNRPPAIDEEPHRAR